jgi:hypothetical protein
MDQKGTKKREKEREEMCWSETGEREERRVYEVFDAICSRCPLCFFNRWYVGGGR